MDDANSDDSLYDLLIKDCKRQQMQPRCDNQPVMAAAAAMPAKKSRRCSCRGTAKTDAQVAAAAANCVSPRRRQHHERRTGPCDEQCDGGRTGCADRGLCRKSFLDVIGQWARTTINWTWCRKSHLIVGLGSFVLGMCVEDFCQCM